MVEVMRIRREKSVVGELARKASRQRGSGRREEQAEAMREFVGIRKRPADAGDAVEYVRSLRRDSRLGRLLDK